MGKSAIRMLCAAASLACLTLAAPTVAVAQQQAQSKTVTVHLQRVAAKEFFNQVRKQTGLNYIVKSGDIDQRRVTVDAVGQPLDNVLDNVCRQLNCRYELRDGYITITANRPERMRKVSGTVLDANNEPLLGVTVQVAGTQNATATNADGRYTIDIPADRTATIHYSYVGMETVTRQLGAKSKATSLGTVVMRDDESLLGEVMVTGYQTISRERTTGSFDKVTAEELASRPTSDLSSALQGLVAGMQGTENEDGTVDFLIRGTSSLYANTSPLVVVDGFPIEGTFASINPNDVESVTVLKDAAAASIWGARSANGVIVVTTKKGARNRKLNVEAQAFWRIGTTPDIDYILSQADSRSSVDYELMTIEHGWNFSDYTPGGIYGLMSPLTEAQELYYNHKYNGLSEADMQAGLDVLRNRSNRSQLKKYLMQQQLLQQYNVNLSGGTEKMDNYLSLMYERNAEATIKRGYERFMLNYNSTYRFNSHITGTAAVTWQKKERETSGVTVSDFANLQPYEMLLNDDGTYAYNTGGFNRQELASVDTSSFPYSDFSYNMLQEVRNRSYKTKSDKLRVQLGLTAKIFKGLDYDIKYQYEINKSNYRNVDGEDTYAVRYDLNYYSDYDAETGTCTKSYLPKGSRINSGRSENHNQVFRNQLTYNNTFASKHDVSALAGIEVSEYVTSTNSDATTWGFNEKTNTITAPYYGTMENIGDIEGTGYMAYYYLLPYFGSSYSERTDRYVSYFGNASYVYDERYGASFSARSDGSNFVSQDKSLRWSPMWSIGAKWNMHKESFMKTAPWVDRLTLRATFGYNGNAEKSTSPQTLISVFSNSTTQTDVASIASYGNPRLRWEKTRTINLGADFSLWRNILSGKVEYYNRQSKDVIGSIAIPSTYGSTTQKFNNAEISNKGIEVELTGKYNIKSLGLGIRSTATFAYNKNVVEDLYNPNIYCYEYMYASTLGYNYYVEGRPVGAVYCYEYAGMKDGVPQVKGPDGSTCGFDDLSLHNNSIGSEEFLTYKGSVISPCTFGWANEFSWKGLSLYVYLTGKMGGVFRAPVAETPPLEGYGSSFISKFMSYYEGDGSTMPAFPADGDYMCYRWGRYMPYLSCFVHDASFIRVKELTLSYQLPQTLIRKIGIKQAKVFCQARDLGMLWTANSLGYDPEWLPGSASGFSNKPATSITLGINVNL